MQPQQSKSSWRRPWAYNSYHDMRRSITERYVYNKLKKLERHSAYKQPYRYAGHQYSEINYQYPGFRYHGLSPYQRYQRRPWNPSFPGDYGPGAGGGAILPDDGVVFFAPCECTIAGPDTVQCGEPWIGQVVPSKCAALNQFAAGVEGVESDELEISGSSTGVLVVTPSTSAGEGEIIICNAGGMGKAFFVCCIEVTVTCCCEQFAVSGSETATQGSTWWGTIYPPCPGATCAVAAGGGGDNGDYSCSVNDPGSLVEISVGGGACGTFTVTITKAAVGDCAQITGTATVRISDAGNWDLDDLVDPACQTDGCGTCQVLEEKYCVEDELCYAYQFRCKGEDCNIVSTCWPGCAPAEPGCEGRICGYYNKTVPWTCDGAGGGWTASCP